MDWDFLVGAPMPPQSQLLHGCFLEADRADRVAQGLDALRQSLAHSFHGPMILLAEEIWQSGRVLRELADRGHVHASRAAAVANHLNVVLPGLSKSLRDIAGHYDDKTVTRELRWRRMYHEMKKEADGMELLHRFQLYNRFLSLLVGMLVRGGGDKAAPGVPAVAPQDRVQADVLRAKIMALRDRQGLPAPTQSPVAEQHMAVVPLSARERPHWAERVFAHPPSSHTDMHEPQRSQARGPFIPAAAAVGGAGPGAPRLPDAARILLRRSFDGDSLGLLLIINSADGGPYFVLRVYAGGQQLFSYRGIHEICVEQAGSTLRLKRWSHSIQGPKLWAVLSFVTWEELVLFHCTFIALKARNNLTVSMDPREYRFPNETRLFQAQIIDDDYQHSLVVYKDDRTRGMRLHAAVWDGELRACPVWTAFVTHQSTSSRWLTRKSKHCVWINEIKLYVFCDKYKEANMRRNKVGAFEIRFVSDEAAGRFKEVFYPAAASEPPGDGE
ncbi:hypothetical protein KVR01_005443 [Diaporthe batatas]|uniref:uncharacterized protein n=1 Tax=Diaporthe batatas TaxID=748121 RepID=UPI001D04A642|nr:uncharacterized protein KVR01_005443 [Diaporthe batatas]KAG8165168.1 hypothetical protein KVR01_005443 [Diaporthe batatas]